MMESDTPLKVLIIGSGPAGLVNARTLLDDGFDVTVVSRVCSFLFDSSSPLIVFVVLVLMWSRRAESEDAGRKRILI